jgi:hypothetical protein
MNFACLLATILPAILLLAGCKSEQTASSVTARVREDSLTTHQCSEVSTTNIYYKIEEGPGCSIFLTQAHVDFFGADGRPVGGTQLVVMKGQFPPPAEMPQSRRGPVPLALPWLDLRDTSLVPPSPALDLIDTSP